MGLGLERPENETWTGEAYVLRLREKRSAHKRYVTKPTRARAVCGQTALQCSLKVEGVQMWDRHIWNGSDSSCLLWRIWKRTFGFHERRRISSMLEDDISYFLLMQSETSTVCG